MAQSKITLNVFLSILKVILLQYYVHVLANFRDPPLSSDCNKLCTPAAGTQVLRKENSEFTCVCDYQMAKLGNTLLFIRCSIPLKNRGCSQKYLTYSGVL